MCPKTKLFQLYRRQCRLKFGTKGFQFATWIFSTLLQRILLHLLETCLQSPLMRNWGRSKRRPRRMTMTFTFVFRQLTVHPLIIVLPLTSLTPLYLLVNTHPPAVTFINLPVSHLLPPLLLCPQALHSTTFLWLRFSNSIPVLRLGPWVQWHVRVGVLHSTYQGTWVARLNTRLVHCQKHVHATVSMYFLGCRTWNKNWILCSRCSHRQPHRQPPPKVHYIKHLYQLKKGNV